MNISLDRIWKDKFRCCLMIVLLFLPSLEVFVYVNEIIHGGAVLIPDYAFFLTCNALSMDYFLQSLFLWFMPLYCLILATDNCIEDYNLNYKNILISKVGRKQYVISNLKKSFSVIFTLVGCALLMNLVLVHIAFHGGIYDPYGDELITSLFYQWEIDYPFLTNLLFTFITAFICGLLSMVGTMLGIILHDKKLVYGVTMLLWFVPFLQKKSLMLLFQPHSEYVLDTLIPIFVEVFVTYTLVIVLGYYKEVHFEKKAGKSCNNTHTFLSD